MGSAEARGSAGSRHPIWRAWSKNAPGGFAFILAGLAIILSIRPRPRGDTLLPSLASPGAPLPHVPHLSVLLPARIRVTHVASDVRTCLG